MFFSPFSFEPADGLRDTDAFPTVPAGETDARNQFQVLFDQLKAYVNQLTGALNASDEGASGADRIAATPLPDLPKEGAATVQGQLNALWDAVERNVAYSLNDNTLTNAKLEPDIKVGSLASLEGVLPNASVTEALLNLASKSGMPHREVFTESGSFTAPTTGLYRITCVGGGGGGSTGSASAGGGGGGFATVTVLLQAGETVPLTVGAGGNGQLPPPNAMSPSPGGETSFGTYLTAPGGLAASTSTPGTGGLPEAGDLRVGGGTGTVTLVYGSSIFAGYGGSSHLGHGGAGRSVTRGDDGTGYGAGGGACGAASLQGGRGAHGVIVVEY